MEQSKIEELARSGGLCVSCGGLHVAFIEHALLGSLVNDLPFCECEDCQICERVRNALDALEVEDTEEEEWQTP